jgi:mono/diheme cytochrome c family protein
MKRALLGLLALVLLLIGAVLALNYGGEDSIADSAAPARPTAQQIARGEYLARAGNCLSCHTARGGVPYAGGRSIETPFGTVYASNLTPDPATGIGQWSAAHFWRALHNGRSRDGRLLYPAFPYPNYTRVTRADSDAIFDYLRSLPPVKQPNRPHELRFPYGTQPALAIWRALYFRPGSPAPDSAQSAEWQRGAYLVQGLGHCNACHASRNVLGASSTVELGGGMIPMQNWYAPSLTSPHQAGVAHLELTQIVALLKTGVAEPAASVLGPMAEVVKDSTQHLNDADLRAMAVYLKSLPPAEGKPPKTAASGVQPPEEGAKLYRRHCVQCHGESGEGAPGAYPRLAGNRAVLLDPPTNLVRVLLAGGFPPATAGNPRPYGMPPFATVLSDDEVAEVASYVRLAWGNRALPVSAFEVQRYRGGLKE